MAGTRPRFTVDEWHQISVRLMKRKAKNASKKAESLTDICTEMTQTLGRTVHERTLRRAMKRMELFKRMHGKPGPRKGSGGAPRYLSAAQSARVDDLTNEHQTEPMDYTANDVKHDLGTPAGPRQQWSRRHTFKDGTSEVRTYNRDSMHERSYNRAFERLGIKAYAIENKEHYDAADRAKRKTFAETHQHVTAAEWEKYFATDEHGIVWSRGHIAMRQLRGAKKKVRRKKGEGQKQGITRARGGKNTRGGKHIKLYFTMCNGKVHYGKCGALLPSGKYTQHAWAKVVKSIGKFARKASGAVGFARVKGIQDGLKSHWAPASRAAMDENRVTFLANFPVRSPDLNPIENLFPHLDAHLRRMQHLHGDTTEAGLMVRVNEFFAKPETAVLVRKLLRSMPARLAKCIELDGAHTGY